jgi:2-oxoacid:acceptor oxidoreductase gamma subunit (pyruvate/2-ketoisovalerate family)
MKQIRIHGRGGQGVVTAAELIAIASFYDGKEAQAFPSFGVERTGAPIESYARIDDDFIKTREQVYHPDVLIIQDASLLQTVDVFAGAKPDTIAIINSSDKKIKAKTSPKNTHINLGRLCQGHRLGKPWLSEKSYQAKIPGKRPRHHKQKHKSCGTSL